MGESLQPRERSSKCITIKIIDWLLSDKSLQIFIGSAEPINGENTAAAANDDDDDGNGDDKHEANHDN